MKIFIWENLDHASNSYHSSGGMVVTAEDEQSARVAANATDGVILKDHEHPVLIADCDYPSSRVWVFPDAGCC